ncbi:hypothetical protein KC19_VG006400 [Ceratodon purpureus]|uniref:Uncharacterized protein n=1 Tax=Ceratodon purpureus TaxID=3225 RepID=A0A8T0HKQ2_CERPU|nr:hypothetical protein KC19_VG006400 [Ceratodon purpureus]
MVQIFMDTSLHLISLQSKLPQLQRALHVSPPHVPHTSPSYARLNSTTRLRKSCVTQISTYEFRPRLAAELQLSRRETSRRGKSATKTTTTDSPELVPACKQQLHLFHAPWIEELSRYNATSSNRNEQRNFGPEQPQRITATELSGVLSNRNDQHQSVERRSSPRSKRSKVAGISIPHAERRSFKLQTYRAHQLAASAWCTPPASTTPSSTASPNPTGHTIPSASTSPHLRPLV